MKKLTSLVALFLMCFGMTAGAQTKYAHVQVVPSSNPVSVVATDMDKNVIEGVNASLALEVTPTPETPASLTIIPEFPHVAILNSFAKGSQKQCNLSLKLDNLAPNTEFKKMSMTLHGITSKNVYCGKHAIDVSVVDAAGNVIGENAGFAINAKPEGPVELSFEFAASQKVAADNSYAVVIKINRAASDNSKYGFKVGVSDIVLSNLNQEDMDALAFEKQKNLWQAMKGYVGFYTAQDVDAACEKANLADAKAFLKSCTPIAVDPAKYYRVVTAKLGTAMNVNKKGEQKVYKENLSELNELWKFEEVAANTYKIVNVNTEKYLAKPVKTESGNKVSWLVPVTDNVNALVVTMTKLAADAECALSYKEGEIETYLCGNSNYLLTTTEMVEDGEHRWFIKPVEQVEVKMNKATAEATESWASLYLPYGVTLPEGVAAYTGKVDGKTLKLNAVEGGVPANCAVILKGSADSYVFNLAEVTATVQNNDLVGTNVNVSLVDPLPEGAVEGTEPTTHNNEYYTLGYTETDGVGMYHPLGKDLEANRAYLKAAAGVNGLKFVFGDVTGVEGVEVAAPADNVYYDFSGRRVAQPVKGLYIVNGKKVYVK